MWQYKYVVYTPKHYIHKGILKNSCIHSSFDSSKGHPATDRGGLRASR